MQVWQGYQLPRGQLPVARPKAASSVPLTTATNSVYEHSGATIPPTIMQVRPKAMPRVAMPMILSNTSFAPDLSVHMTQQVANENLPVLLPDPHADGGPEPHAEHPDGDDEDEDDECEDDDDQVCTCEGGSESKPIKKRKKLIGKTCGVKKRRSSTDQS